MAFPLVGVEVGACGMRLGCRVLNLTGRHRVVAASDGAQPQGKVHVAHALVTYGPDDTVRVAKAMPPKDRTVPPDETWTGGLGLITMDPASHCSLLAPRAQARAQTTWQAGMAPACAQCNGRVIPSTSAAAPGLLASVEPAREAPHSPA